MFLSLNILVMKNAPVDVFQRFDMKKKAFYLVYNKLQ